MSSANEVSGAAVRWAYLFGNGLSLMFNAEYFQLERLTEGARRLLGDAPSLGGAANLLEELEGIVADLESDEERGRIRTFEELAGPIDRLSNVLSAVGPLVRLADAESQAAIRKLWAQLRNLYKRVVGVVLHLVMHHAGGEGEWGSLEVIADRLVERCLHQGRLDVFSLNYDALLDAVLVRKEQAARATSQAFTLMDEFDGRTRYEIPVLTPDETIENVEALAWRTESYDPPEPVLRLHHLHGAGTWMRYKNVIYKATNLQALRDCRIYQSWAAGIEGQEEEGFVDPVVLLGDQKETYVRRNPFDQTYDALVRAITEATNIGVAGYGFRDLPLNRILRDFRTEARVRIITTSLSDYAVKWAFGLPTWPRELPEWLAVDSRGLPTAFVEEATPPSA